MVVPIFLAKIFFCPLSRFHQSPTAPRGIKHSSAFTRSSFAGFFTRQFKAGKMTRFWPKSLVQHGFESHINALQSLIQQFLIAQSLKELFPLWDAHSFSRQRREISGTCRKPPSKPDLHSSKSFSIKPLSSLAPKEAKIQKDFLLWFASLKLKMPDFLWKNYNWQNGWERFEEGYLPEWIDCCDSLSCLEIDCQRGWNIPAWSSQYQEQKVSPKSICK